MALLTKSRFKLGLQCATKLYYDSFRDIYHNKSEGDSFLQALAEGGFQVGELAKFMYPGGVDIDTLDRQEAIRLTEEALERDEVTIYEAAIQVGHKFIRVDILRKTPHGIQLIEVKSKSCDGVEEGQFFGKKGGLDSSWKPYLEDVVFQYLVMQEYLEARGEKTLVFPYLMCSDKQKQATVDGLHSMFRISEVNGRKTCIPREGIAPEDLGADILTAIRLNDAVDAILNYDYSTEHPAWEVSRFEEVILHFEQLLLSYEAGGSPWPEPMCKTCKTCEFRLDDSPEAQGKESGFDTCGRSLMAWNDEQLKAPKAYDVWNYPASKDRIAEGRWFMQELDQSDVETKDILWEEPALGDGLSTVQRKYLQVQASQTDQPQPYVDTEGLREAMEEVTYPLHFIDFETAAPAIPFFNGYRPYKGLCFQFSHHIMEKDGSVRHATEYLGLGQGEDPTWGFIDALYEALRHDEGTIFRYATHENTYLGYVRQALEERSPFDETKTQELIRFIHTITQPTRSVPDEERWKAGPRNMLDLCKWVKDFYWHPRMGGSNSIKYVLPAILEHSTVLKEKYGQAIYGSHSIPSLNFKDKTWVQHDEEGKLCDPYSLLPPVLKDFGEMQQEEEEIYVDGQLINGGAAMTAWAYMQMEEMSEAERDGLAEALKCYCELDTMAMVMIWEGWAALMD